MRGAFSSAQRAPAPRAPLPSIGRRRAARAPRPLPPPPRAAQPQQQPKQHQPQQHREPQIMQIESISEDDESAAPPPGVRDPFAHIVPYAPYGIRRDPNKLVVFAIPPASLHSPLDDVLRCPDIRHLPRLAPRPNPLLLRHKDLGCVFDGDRVALNVVSYAAAAHAGAGAPQQPGGGDDGGGGAGSFAAEAVAGPEGEVEDAVAAAAAAARAVPVAAAAAAAAAAVRAAPAAAAAATEAAEEAGQHVLRARHGHYVELPPLPCQQAGGCRVVVPLPTFAMRAGVRDTVYFAPEKVTAAIVTTGGIVPGMNDVVSAMVQRLGMYGVPEGQILGIRYGFEGFYSRSHTPQHLSPRCMDTLHLSGGSCLGSSSPLPRADEASLRLRRDAVAQRLRDWGINVLLVVGGEGGTALSADLARWCALEELDCAVVCVPKSIDNDFLLLDRSIGFDTAVEQAQRALIAAKTEASSALRGIGLVKLFGRRSGFLTMQAALASGVVDVCLIPEVKIDVDLLLSHMRRLLEEKGHAVVCVAEGAGQDLLYKPGEPRPMDEAGNPVLRDIGARLRSLFKSGALGEVDLKVIEPKHLVEATPSGASDHVLAKTLGHHAVDAAFAGFTGVVCGVVNGHHCLLPAPVVTQSYKTVHPGGRAYNRLRTTTGQPF
ncbi:phosphofructokinase [Raphidocelis subcapitata]|uniref:Phosphofructokinase n=1 Tax=Raphidocelis subcapitata TaxID=307507 RepID=A0A2V0P513_9CHLO|nr:phosphofructokinase [Raphidocelis subcapitata]|eukprot:GBF94971.1 phosphofructokinase [Raphidocelis subcapitata]